MAVCDKTFKIYTQAPYGDQIIPVPPHEPVRPEDAQEFDCRRNTVRHPRETKGQVFEKTELPTTDCCGPETCC